jgi:hypothetical protein
MSLMDNVWEEGKSLHTPPHVATGHVSKGKRKKRIFKEQLIFYKTSEMICGQVI